MKALIFLFCFVFVCSGTTCPSVFDSGSSNVQYLSSGQTQTFLATKSGPVNLIALYALASTPSAITMTLETLGGGSVLGTSTQSFSGGNVYFTFSNKPVITSGTNYQFTVSNDANVQFLGAVAYIGGSLSVDSGDYFFKVETLCITPSTCPATIVPGDGLSNSANPTYQAFVQPFLNPLAGTLTTLTINVKPSVQRGANDITVQLLDASDNLLGTDTVAATTGDITFTYNIPVLANTPYKFKILPTDYAVTRMAYPYQDGNPLDNVYFTYDIICSAGTSGDPHFYGFLGQKFDVMGQSYEIYNIVTMSALQINARFIPYYKTATQIEPTGTMIGDLGIKFGSNRFFINPNTTDAILNDSPVSLATEWSLDFAEISVDNRISGRTYEFTITTPELSLTFVRKFYAVSGLDLQYHFDYKAKLFKSNVDIHGLLGQTAENKFFAQKTGAFQYLDGAEDDYRIKSNDLFDDTFKFNKYVNL